MQPTSLQARKEISRKLGHKQLEVHKALELAGAAMTNCELARTLGWPINTVTPRIFELRQKGLVREHCKRRCAVTGKMAIAWRVARPEEAGERQMELWQN